MDSICRECFITVATATSRSALESEEQRHRCDPALLERYKKVRTYKNYPTAVSQFPPVGMTGRSTGSTLRDVKPWPSLVYHNSQKTKGR